MSERTTKTDPRDQTKIIKKGVPSSSIHPPSRHRQILYLSDPSCTIALCSSRFRIPGIHVVRIILLSLKGMKQRGMFSKKASGILSGRNPVLYLWPPHGGRERKKEKTCVRGQAG